MPGSRAMKEKLMCSPSNHKGPGKESVSKPKNKQYNQTGPKATGPNYPKIRAFVDGKVQ